MTMLKGKRPHEYLVECEESDDNLFGLTVRELLIEVCLIQLLVFLDLLFRDPHNVVVAGHYALLRQEITLQDKRR